MPMLLLLDSPVVDPHVTAGQVLVSMACLGLGVIVKWAVSTMLKAASSERATLLAAIKRLDYIDTISSATYKVVSQKFPGETGQAVQEVLRTKAEAEAKADRLSLAVAKGAAS